MEISEKKYRYRKSDVCAVCRRRKIRCDRVKPCCGNCKKMNQSHLCRYDTLPVLVEDDRRPRSTANKFLDSFSIRKSGGKGIEHGQQMKLQQQQHQFQQDLLQKQQHQQYLQAQMAAKYAPSGSVPGDYQPGVPAQIPQQSFNGAHYQPPPPHSYNMEYNLKTEYEQLKVRISQIETQLPAIKQEETLVPPIKQAYQSFVTDSSRISTGTLANGDKTANTPSIDIDDENPNTNIDPAFFDEGEYLKISHIEGLSNLLEFEPGLFTGLGVLQNDQYFALIYMNIINHFEIALDSFDSLKTSKKRVSKRDLHLSALLENENYQLEDMMKAENINLLSAIKAIEKANFGISKKLFWLFIEKFFEKFPTDFLPLSLEKEKFLKDIETFVGSKESTDQKIKVTVDMKKNQDIINFTLVAFILRVFQLSLKSTFHLDKDTANLFKPLINEPNNEVEIHFQVLLLLLERFDLNKEQRLKLHIIQSFLVKHSFEPIQELPLQVEKLVVGKLMDKDSNVRAFSAMEYITSNTMNGTSFLLDIDQFQLLESHQQIKDIFTINAKLLDRLNNTAGSPTHLSTIERFLYELHETMSKHKLHFNDFKTDTTIPNLKKISKTLVTLEQLYIQANVVGLINLHFDKQESIDNMKFFNKIICQIDLIQQSTLVIMDILKNYHSYYQPGFEFMLIGKINDVLANNFNLLLSYFLRFFQSLETSQLALQILKFFYNMAEELQNSPILKNYYSAWKTTNRLKCILYLLKANQQPEGFKLFNNAGLIPEFPISKILSNGLIIGSEESQKSNRNILFKKLEALNNHFFDSEITKLNSLDEFLNAVKFTEEPELNASFMF